MLDLSDFRDKRIHFIGIGGISMSGLAEIIPQLSFYYQGTYGKGISQYVTNLSGNNLDLVLTPKNPGPRGVGEILEESEGEEYIKIYNTFAAFHILSANGFSRSRPQVACPAADPSGNSCRRGNNFLSTTEICFQKPLSGFLSRAAAVF